MVLTSANGTQERGFPTSDWQPKGGYQPLQAISAGTEEGWKCSEPSHISSCAAADRQVVCLHLSM